MIPDPAPWRDAFAHLRERVYLDTAAAGLCWSGHGAAVARFYDQIKSRGFDARPEWQAMTQAVRGRLAALLGTAPDAVTFVSNATEALNLAAHSLQFAPGDRIVMAADEFPSVAQVWQVARRAGAEILTIPVPHEAERTSALLDAAGTNTRLLVVSQTHWGTGTTLDLSALGRHCRAHGTLLMVDGTQAMGAVPTDLSPVDIYAASFFKWMLSGFGIGLLATSAQARAAMQPAYQGYANLDHPDELQYAHVNVPAMYGLDATLDFFESIGWPVVFQRVRDLGSHLVEAAARRRLDLVTPPHMRAGIFVFRCRDGEAVRLELARRNISVSARGSGIRVSPHFYNTTDDIDQCLSALADILAAG
jgi:cysteine desulfurase/selenocysteine lyase